MSGLYKFFTGVCFLLLLPSVAMATDYDRNINASRATAASRATGNRLWYRQPARVAWAAVEARKGARNGADAWMEYALPMGGGPMGVCLMGGVELDEIQFNEKGLWSGSALDNGRQYGSYLNFGWLKIEMLDAPEREAEYIRWLDLDSAKAEVRFRNALTGTNYRREYFVSRASRLQGGVKDGSVAAIRYTASQRGGINVRVLLETGCMEDAEVRYDKEGAQMFGVLPSVVYGARMEVKAMGGTQRLTEAGLEVRGADTLVVLLKAMTTGERMEEADFFAPEGSMTTALRRAGAMGFDSLYAELLHDYEHYFGTKGRTFALEDACNDLPTDLLVDAYTKDLASTDQRRMLEQLYFHYGRYLAIASNDSSERFPSNLQGIWNHACTPPWNSDYHTNINLQMNYWPMEVLGLGDLHLPLLRWIVDGARSEGWQRNAREVGQQQGWTTFTENNIYGGVGAFAHDYVVANAWLCSHLWNHYLYTRNPRIIPDLERPFEPLATACRFWMDRLLRNAEDGTYECPNEYSPEQGPVENGVAHAQQLVAELFAEALAADRMLREGHGEPLFSEEERERLEAMYADLDKGLAMEVYDGAWGEEVNGVRVGDTLIREWKYSPYSVGQNGHRHLSHLMGLYPFGQIRPGTETFDAAVRSLQLRGDASTGWSMGWKMNLWARALDGNHAHAILELALHHHSMNGGGVYYNLWDAHPPFQIDGNFGATAGIAEMLLQSEGGCLRLLPALPDAWPAGYSGLLKGQGNVEVRMRWSDGRLTEAVLELLPTGEEGVKPDGGVLICYPRIANYKVRTSGRRVKVEVISEDMIRVDAEDGGTVVLVKG